MATLENDKDTQQVHRVQNLNDAFAVSEQSLSLLSSGGVTKEPTESVAS